MALPTIEIARRALRHRCPRLCHCFQRLSSNWLAPLELAGQADGSNVLVVNRLSQEELAEALAADASQPLGCLPMKLEDYAELLRWLSGQRKNGSDSDQQHGIPSILEELKLNATEFAELVNQFGKRFSPAAGCPASLDAEAKRRGRVQIHGPGKKSLQPCRSQ